MDFGVSNNKGLFVKILRIIVNFNVFYEMLTKCELLKRNGCHKLISEGN